MTDQENCVEVAVKVFTVNKKKKKVTDDDLDSFEEKLRQRSVVLCEAIREPEQLSADDYSVTVTI